LMAYLDTNVIVSYCFKDENHAKVTKIIEELRMGRKQLYISPLTSTELFAAARTAAKLKIRRHKRGCSHQGSSKDLDSNIKGYARAL